MEHLHQEFKVILTLESQSHKENKEEEYKVISVELKKRIKLILVHDKIKQAKLSAD